MKANALLGMVIVAVISCSHALAASSATAITNGTVTVAEATTTAFQEGVVGDYAVGTGVTATKVGNIMMSHTNNTLVPAMAALGQAAQTGDAGAVQMNAIFANVLNGTGIDGSVLTTSESEQVLRVMSGETAGSFAQVGQVTAAGLFSAMGGRADTIVAERSGMVEKFGSNASLASARMNSNFANRFWAAGFYQNQDMDTKDDYAGYKYKAWGGSFGYDRAFGPVTAGAAFTYSRGEFEQKGFHDDNKVDNYGVSLYANYYNCSGFFADIYGGYNYGDNELKTWIPGAGVLTGDNHTNTYWAGGRLGYDFKPNNSFTLTPTVGIYYSHSKSSAYTSSLNGLSAFNYNKISNHGWVLPIELTAKYKVDLDDCSSVTFSVTGGYNYNLTNKGARGSYGFAGVQDVTTTINGVKPGRSGWTAGAGVKYQRNRFDFSVGYRYDGKSKYDGHKVIGAIGVSF